MLHNFGAKLRHIRKSKGWTQAELAQQLDIGRPELTHLETGRRFPRTISFVLRTAALFEVTAEYLLNEAISVDDMKCSTWPPSASKGVLIRFGEKLLQLRTAKGQTQTELAQALMMRSQAHISLLEANRAEPSVERIMRLAEFFDVTTDELLNDAITLG